MAEIVLSELDSGVRTVTLNRPERLNAINAPLIAALNGALTRAHADPDTRVIVLRGAGRAFCSGDDLTEFSEQAASESVARRYIEDLQEITRLLVFGRKVVIGAVHGWAAGGGFEWMIGCDLVLMARGTRCFFPESGLGMVPTGAATALLPGIVGVQRARALIYLGEKIDANEAFDMGLAWRIHAEEALFGEARKLAARLAGLPERGLRDGKRLLNRPEPSGVEAALRLETESTVPAFVDPVTRDRVSKFTG